MKMLSTHENQILTDKNAKKRLLPIYKKNRVGHLAKFRVKTKFSSGFGDHVTLKFPVTRFD